jgi:hypothetical protein
VTTLKHGWMTFYPSSISKIMEIYTAYRDGTGGWVINDVSSPKRSTHKSIDTIPEPVKSKLAVLLAAADGFRHDGIGRRIDGSTFWIF